MNKLFFTTCLCISQFAFAQVKTEYYPNGSKQSEGEYMASGTGAAVMLASDGSSRPAPTQTKNGTWNYWYDSGKMSAQENYTNGLSTGIWKSWYPDGALSSQIDFGTQKAVFYYNNGKKQSEGKMLPNKVFDGKWLGWSENGQKSFEGTYNAGKKDGDWTWYDESGKIASQQKYANDVLLSTQK